MANNKPSIIKANVEKDGDAVIIRMIDDSGNIDIPMTDENPILVKKAFNALILLMKKRGGLQIELTTPLKDLFDQVAKEYIAQLNRELTEVYGEMVDLGLKT